MMEPRLGNLASQETRALGAAAGLLGAARDSAATLEVIDSLEARRRGHVPSRSLTALRRRLSRAPANPASELEKASNDLHAIRSRIGEWPTLPNGFGFAASGLRKSYRRGKSALAQAQLDPHPETFHTLRKRVKDHWYQVRLFSGMWGDNAREAQLRELQECLGDEHNLTVLEANATLVPTVRKLVDQSRSELRERALSLAAEIFSEKPKDHDRRIHSLWNGWRQAAELSRKGPASAVARRRKQSAA